ncbi:MAG: protein-L-isoaspartate(D-aspartate) O-methyltransferase [Thermoanaerobaculia bacterium]
MKSPPILMALPSRASSSGDTGDHPSRRFGAGGLVGWARISALALICWPLTVAAQADPYFSQRRDMVDHQVRQRGIEQRGLLQAMENVPRHLFVPEVFQPEAYEDSPVEIAPGQTMSQAYVSALMISLLDLDGDEKVLEIGTGSGYDAAVLSRMASRVYTIEIDRDLGRRATQTLGALGYANVRVRIGDGYRGWPEQAPFDAILVTAAPPQVPEPLIEQLKIGGKMVVPVGNLVQDLLVITKTADGLERRRISLVNFGPMTGEVEDKSPRDER